MTTQGRATKLTLTVKRPNGEVEHVVHPTMTTITDVQFKQMQRATKAAGKGEVVSYEIEREEVTEQKVYKNIHAHMMATREVSETERAMTLNGGTN
jgi:hypothetical protein